MAAPALQKGSLESFIYEKKPSTRPSMPLAEGEGSLGTSPAMTDPDEARYLARASNLLATFRQIAQDEHPNVIAEAALALGRTCVLGRVVGQSSEPGRDGAARAGPVTDDSGPDRRE